MQGRRHAWWTPQPRLTGGAPSTLRPGHRRSKGWRPDPLCTTSGGPSGPKLKRWCARPSRSFGGIRCTCAMIASMLMRHAPSGTGSVGIPPLPAHHVAMTHTPAGHTVCSDIGIASAFAHYYAWLGEPSSDTADFDVAHMRHVQAQLANYAVRSRDLDNADSTLDAVAR